MTRSFKNHENAYFRVGREVPGNDVNISYYEVPQLTPNRSLNVVDNLNLIPELEGLTTGFTKQLYTNPDGILYDNCSPFIVTNDNVTISDEQIDGETVYYFYDLRYLHYSEKFNPIEDITFYLNDNEFDIKNEFIEYEEVNDNIYDITVYSDFTDNEYDMYEIEYNPVDINIPEYREIINFDPIYSEVEDNPGDGEYKITDAEGTNYIVTNYEASTEEQDYHDDQHIGYEDAEFDYSALVEGYRAEEGEGVYVYFLIDSTYSMSSSSGFISLGYDSQELAINLADNILEILNTLSPDDFNVKYNITFFNESSWWGASGVIHRFPGAGEWYDRGDRTTISNIYPVLRGSMDDITQYYEDSINQLNATKEERKGHKTIFVLMSDGRSKYYVDSDEGENLTNRMHDAEVDYIWSYIMGPSYNATSWGGYTDRDVDLMQNLAQSDNASFLEVDPDTAYDEDEAAEEFEVEQPTLPQIIEYTLQEGNALAPGGFCNSHWINFMTTDKELPGDSLHPENLKFLGEINGPACLLSSYYFGYEEIPDELELTEDYIDYEEV